MLQVGCFGVPSVGTTLANANDLVHWLHVFRVFSQVCDSFLDCSS